MLGWLGFGQLDGTQITVAVAVNVALVHHLLAANGCCGRLPRSDVLQDCSSVSLMWPIVPWAERVGVEAFN